MYLIEPSNNFVGVVCRQTSKGLRSGPAGVERLYDIMIIIITYNKLLRY